MVTFECHPCTRVGPTSRTAFECPQTTCVGHVAWGLSGADADCAGLRVTQYSDNGAEDLAANMTMRLRVSAP